MDAKQIAQRLVEVESHGGWMRRVLAGGVEVFEGSEVEAEQFYNTLVLAVEEKLAGMGFFAMQESAR